MNDTIDFGPPSGSPVACGVCGVLVDDIIVHTAWHQDTSMASWRDGYMAAHFELVGISTADDKSYTPTERNGITKALKAAAKNVSWAHR